jgi:hypothetical protein
MLKDRSIGVSADRRYIDQYFIPHDAISLPWYGVPKKIIP